MKATMIVPSRVINTARSSLSCVDVGRKQRDRLRPSGPFVATEHRLGSADGQNGAVGVRTNGPNRSLGSGRANAASDNSPRPSLRRRLARETGPQQ